LKGSLSFFFWSKMEPIMLVKASMHWSMVISSRPSIMAINLCLRQL